MAKASKLSEVARLAGVAPITASRAIRGTGYVSDAARERIMAAAAQLNYTPDMLARRMRGDKSKLIGVFMNNYGPVVLHELVRAIGEQARKRDYDLLLFNADRFDSPDRMTTCATLSKLCDGLLLLMPTADDRFLDLVERQQLSCALVFFDARQLALPTIVLENRIGARRAVEHLIGLGHRRIAFIAGTKRTGQSAERERGYTEALAAAGIAVDPALVVDGAFNQPGGFAATRRLLELEAPPTAIFAANDEMAFGAIDAVASRGLKVPADVSVVGFDDISTASHVFPRLTTMHQPYEALAERAVREVVEMIEGRPPAAARIAFETELVVRDSTGPAPA
ncbi:LacI family DNA-binding transcriptional regulator [Massilia arenae]|uniref:LacI family transcriptional regulator n=1 Tax=Massilia arenae TaxID=2603288 RepID=A0A5C7FXJ4_9BURK|nr:LacI family DNA-binding transcriptional regulator [Massilia arenae]TXF97198.1 LacI family transcriptional regulator [Massilia arenae]